MRGSHPLPDQLPGEHTGRMPQAACRSSWYNRLHCCHSHTHSHMVTADRSMVVGHVPTVHKCSFMCTNHIDMIAHISAFLRVGEHCQAVLLGVPIPWFVSELCTLLGILLLFVNIENKFANCINTQFM